MASAHSRSHVFRIKIEIKTYAFSDTSFWKLFWKRNKTLSLFAPEIPTQEIPYHVWTGVTVKGDDSSAVLPSMRTELIGWTCLESNLQYMMCAQMNNLDEIQMCDDQHDTKARNDMLDSQDIKDLDDLLESIEDHDEYYSEIFDTIMYE